MKIHTNDFKNEIKQFGKQIDSKITYTIDGQVVELGKEQLNSITPHYEGSILKSAMKQLDVDSNVEIPTGTIINYKFGVLVNNAYEYVDYGNYVVYEVEKQEDTRSWKITCYDKMLYSMIPYEALEITYPITIVNYLKAICEKLGLSLSNEDFINNDKIINSELYLDADGNSLDYTFRDVLDEIAGATGSTICINENDEIEVRYINNAGAVKTTVEGTNISIEDSEDTKADLELEGNTTQDGTPTPDAPQPVNVVTGRQEIRVDGKNLINQVETNKYAGSNGNVVNGNTNYLGINEYVNCMPNTTYSVSFQHDNSSAVLYVSYKDNEGNFISRNSYSTERTFTTPSNAYYLFFYLYKTSEFTTIDGYIQLEKGSSATTYEAYKGKSYEINLGKNILDTSTITSGTSNGIDYDNNNGTITLDGTATANSFIATSQASAFWLETGTYTLSANNETAVEGTNNYIRLVSSSGTAISGTSANFTAINNKITFTLTEDTTVRFQIRTNSGTTYDNFVIRPQLEKGNEATDYTPYKEPIELCKIGDYQDRIFKNTGKNLFDKDNANVMNAYFNTGNDKTLTSANSTRTIYIPCQPNTTYTISKITTARFYFGYTKETPQKNVEVFGRIGGNNLSTPLTITTGADAKYLVAFIYHSNYDTTITLQDILDSIQIEKGSEATSYEPYGKGIWYIEKNIGKVVLDGSETWSSSSSLTNTRAFNLEQVLPYKATGSDSTNAFVNYFKGNTNGYNVDEECFWFNGSGRFRVRINKTLANDVATLKTWLSTHNTIVYYVYATPTYTEITDSELISQLESIRILEGLNNISVSSGDLSSPLKLTYVSEIDTIDEEYLKDVNVNFGEKYGKINSIVLSRSAESDNIYLRNEESVENDGLCEIKIKDNQIMNNNDRYVFLQGLLKALDGLYYYINDFTSTGITYYDLCDRYNVSIDGKKYKCIMFNNEVDITQGLEEQVYTEMPEESETDYTKSDKTDIRERQSYIIVDKQNARIDSVVSSVSTLTTRVDNQDGQIVTLGTRLTQTENELTATITSLEEDGVSKVKNTIATLDDNGLSISTDTSKISTTMTNNEFKITDSGGTPLAHFGYDEEEGISVARMDNITVENYLTTGNHRIEDYTEDGEERTGFFYIGG